MNFQQETEELITQASKSEKVSKRVQQKLLRDFRDYARHTKVIIMYRYCFNLENKLRGRQGRPGGSRYATLNFESIPDNQIPQSRKPEDDLVRYYDLTRLGWRSFKKDMFITITAFWSDEDKNFVDNPEEAGLRRNKLDKNHLYKFVDRKDTEDERKKRELVKQREEEKRNREIEKTARRLEKLEKGTIDLKSLQSQIILRNIK